MFGSVPKTLWSKSHPADDLNRIELAARALLLKADDRAVLIDTGLGTKFTPKELRIYGVDTSRYEINKSLAQCGITPDDVTDVILTHLHFDHAGGCTSGDGDRVVQAFPKARHYVQSAHWQHALKPTEKDKASFMGADFLPLFGENVLHFVDGPVELFPQVSLMVFNGHTPAQQLPRISSGGKTVFFCGDLFPTAAHLRLPYILAYDLWPITTLEEKRGILELAFAEQWLMFFSHDPRIAVGKLRKSDKGFEIDPAGVDF